MEYYKLYLEDYRYPRIYGEVRPYFGTMEDILGLAERLSGFEGTAIRYRDTIDAIESFHLDPNVEHWMVGRRYRLLEPMEEICRYDIVLRDLDLGCSTFEETYYRVRAEEVRVSQILLQCEEGFVRCLRANYLQLQVGIPKMGWYYPGWNIRGFPGMVTWENDVHTQHLYVEQCTYAPEERELAMKEITDPDKIQLSLALGDIIGEV